MHGLHRPANRPLLWIAFAIMLASTVVAGLLIDMHPHFAFEDWPAFFAVYGFLACIAMVVCAKLLGAWLKRDADYHDR